MEKVIVFVIVILGNFLAGPSMGALPEYSIVDLGIGNAYGINSSGWVVGSTAANAWLWNGDEKINLGPGYAYDINSSGQVVGNDSFGAFMWDNGTKIDLGENFVFSLNDSGQVVGYPHIGFGAIIWENDTTIDLGTLGGLDSNGYGINNIGQVVGSSENTIESTDYHAFLWEDDVMTDIGTLGGNNSLAHDINNNSQIVGWANNSDGYFRAYLWEDSMMTDIGVLGGANSHSYAYAINDLGQTVGYSWDLTTGNSNAFIFYEDELINLNSIIPQNTGWDLLREAWNINNNGQIVGFGEIGGETHGFLMTPVPEPATLLLLGLGGFVLRRRK